MNIKVGDWVRHKNYWPDFYEVSRVEGDKFWVKVVRYGTEASYTFAPDTFEIVTAKVDWTKPLQDTYGPVHLVGKRADGRYVVENQLSTVIYTVNADGSREGRLNVTNAPPPPIWPVIKWYVSFLQHGKPNISGRKDSHEEAVKFLARRVADGCTDCAIKEVTFDGKA